MGRGFVRFAGIFVKICTLTPISQDIDNANARPFAWLTERRKQDHRQAILLKCET
jgi:hypothetical protein